MEKELSVFLEEIEKDYNKNVMGKEIAEDSFSLSEDVKTFIESLNMVHEDDKSTLANLERMYHVAVPNEKAIIKKSIDELIRRIEAKEKQSKIKNKTQIGVKRKKFYDVYGEWGRQSKVFKNINKELELSYQKDTTEDSLTPDYWYGTQPSLLPKEYRDSSRTFFYLVHSDRIIAPKTPSCGFAHVKLIKQAIEDGSVTTKDVDPKAIKGINQNEYNISDILYSLVMENSARNKIFFTSIHGRTGPYPVDIKPEHFDAVELYASIWTPRSIQNWKIQEKLQDIEKVIDKMMIRLNETLNENIRKLLVPWSV